MRNNTQTISGIIAAFLLVLIVAANAPSLYAAGKDFGRTIHAVLFNRK